MGNVGFDLKAFYDALNDQRILRLLTWKEVALQTGVSASTLTRMGQGKSIGINGLAVLLNWAGLRFEAFVMGDPPTQYRFDPLAEIEASYQTRLRELADSLADIMAKRETELIRLVTELGKVMQWGDCEEPTKVKTALELDCRPNNSESQ